jgi:hypothetical protein
MSQEIAPFSDDPYEAACTPVVGALVAADNLDFRGALEQLSDAHQSIISHLQTLEDDPATTKFESLRQLVEFLATIFQAQSFRLERNPGKARETYVLAEQKAAQLFRSGSIDPVLLPAVQNFARPIPVLLSLCSATENVMRGNIDAARIDVEKAETALFGLFKKAGINVDRPDPAGVASDLDAQPAEDILAPIGIGCDFFVTSSLIKLQYSMQTQKYGEELEPSRRINALFDVFSAHIAKVVVSLPTLQRFQTIVQSTAALARGCWMIVEGGAAAEEGNFAAAYGRARDARTYLNEASKRMFETETSASAMAQEILLNLRMFMVPQLEDRWRVAEANKRDIVKLEDEIEQMKGERIELIKGLSSRIGVTVNSTNELNALIQNSVSTQVSTYDCAFDQLGEILEKARKAGGTADPGIAEKIKSGRSSEKLPAKIATMKSVVTDMAKIVDSVAKTAPTILAAFGVIAKLFGG